MLQQKVAIRDAFVRIYSFIPININLLFVSSNITFLVQYNLMLINQYISYITCHSCCIAYLIYANYSLFFIPCMKFMSWHVHFNGQNLMVKRRRRIKVKEAKRFFRKTSTQSIQNSSSSPFLRSSFENEGNNFNDDANWSWSWNVRN